MLVMCFTSTKHVARQARETYRSQTKRLEEENTMTTTIQMSNGTFTITDEQISKIKEIRAESRYDAIDQVAMILGTKTVQTATLAIVAAGKKIYINETTIGDITYSKGKVMTFELWDNESEKFFYHEIKINKK